jgi:transposase
LELISLSKFFHEFSESAYKAELEIHERSAAKELLMPAIFVGIDVCKSFLDCASRSDDIGAKAAVGFRVPNNPQGLEELVHRLSQTPPVLVVLEATGGFEMPAVGALLAAKIPVAVVNPRQVRDFAKAVGQLAKTDAIDAAILAHFAHAVRPRAHFVTAEDIQSLKELTTRRRQLLEMIKAEGNRLSHASSGVRPNIERSISYLKLLLKELDGELENFIQQSPLWREKEQLLRSVPGVGRVTASTLIAALPELGTLTGKQVAKLVGVAPLNRDSGQRRGKRCVWGGRSQVRAVLYMAALVATQKNALFRQFYQGLLARGKCKKVALTACMRKLLVILNAMLKQKCAWNPSLAA